MKNCTSAQAAESTSAVWKVDTMIEIFYRLLHLEGFNGEENDRERGEED